MKRHIGNVYEENVTAKSLAKKGDSNERTTPLWTSKGTQMNVEDIERWKENKNREIRRIVNLKREAILIMRGKKTFMFGQKNDCFCHHDGNA